eukprot:5941988-Alexandrium_andersonii.AAC.1
MAARLARPGICGEIFASKDAPEAGSKAAVALAAAAALAAIRPAPATLQPLPQGVDAPATADALPPLSPRG